MSSRPDIIRMVTLSTAHLQEAVCTVWLSPTSLHVYCLESEYGWHVWVPEEPAAAEEDELPADLVECFAYARTLGCEWINFDRDAPVIEDLTHYDW